jgi:hypothetical protein
MEMRAIRAEALQAINQLALFMCVISVSMSLDKQMPEMFGERIENKF